MNLNQIESFLAITKTLNFTAAARQLGIPQSTISRQINDLESQLSVRLFYRTKRDVHLTDEGKTFLPFAREMADAAAKGVSAVRRLRDGSDGQLSIAVTPAAEKTLCKYLEEFHRQYPAILVDIDRISGGYTLMDDVESTYDFYFLYGDMLGESEEYESMMTHRERIGLARASSIQTPLLSSEFILLSEEADPILYMQAMNYCRTHRFSPNVINTFDEVSSLLLSLSSGMGVTFLPESIAEGLDKSTVDFTPLEDESYYISCIAAWKKSLLNPAAELFLKVIQGSSDK